MLLVTLVHACGCKSGLQAALWQNNSPALEQERSRAFFLLDQGGGLTVDASFAATPEFQRRSSPLLEFVRKLADRSRVIQPVRAFAKAELVPHAAAAGSVLEAGMDGAALAPPRDPLWEDAWTVTERLIAKMSDYAQRNGSQLVVVSVPFSVQVHPDRQLRAALQTKLGVSDLFYPDRRIEAFARGKGIPVIALVYEMQRLAESGRVYFHGFENTEMGVGHWNERGHRAAADIIARRLCAR